MELTHAVSLKERPDTISFATRFNYAVDNSRRPTLQNQKIGLKCVDN